MSNEKAEKIKNILKSPGNGYVLKNNRFCFIETEKKDFAKNKEDSLIAKLKTFVKQNPRFFMLAYYLFGASFVGKSAKKALAGTGKDKVILNLGASVKKIREDAINVDMFDFANVDVIADISSLPFKDNSADAIVSESVLEHTKNPIKIMQEAYRILKPGGLIYFTAPFMVSFHSSPNDYYRWTEQGIRQLAKQSDFTWQETGVRHGPTSALFSVLNEWLALLLCLGVKPLYQFWVLLFTFLTFPFKMLDYLLQYLPQAKNLCLGFYCVAKKHN